LLHIEVIPVTGDDGQFIFMEIICWFSGISREKGYPTHLLPTTAIPRELNFVFNYKVKYNLFVQQTVQDIKMTESKRIRVMLVDDHAVVRSGLSAFLLVYPDLELVGEAESGEDAVARVSIIRPDVILMDLVMPGMDGVATTRAIRQKFPDIQIVALTSFKEENLVQGALQAGAIGYLLKNVTAAELVSAIRSAFARRMTLSSEAATALVNSTSQGVPAGQMLTEREQEVLALIVEGLNNSEIARKLVVSTSTIKFHTANIYSKLGVDNRVAAVSLALQRKLV
jgi:two-component system, NarL family, response regulator LiaR